MTQIFRDERGNANLSRDAGLKLELRDFARPSLPQGFSPGRASDLTDYFLIDSVTLWKLWTSRRSMVRLSILQLEKATQSSTACMLRFEHSLERQ